MARRQRVLQAVLRGNADANIAFADLRNLLRSLGFEERIRGSHYIFTKEGVEEILNIQARGSKSKPYQVKQVRQVIVRYKLAGETDGEAQV
ncbi:MAG TPA: type II toxin-antitoxin system HicA family toxin [Candidatus Acidoferrales bacterium]|nr:type II toxin-antitoxin system HicA family toxin [Candidatus Acidoferrales bacterium]